MITSKSKKVYQARADIMKALAHPLRLEITDLLSGQEFCVEDIARGVDAERSNVSRHLSVLANAGLVESRKEGLKVFYSLKVPCILNFFGCVEEVLLQQIKDREALFE